MDCTSFAFDLLDAKGLTKSNRPEVTLFKIKIIQINNIIAIMTDIMFLKVME